MRTRTLARPAMAGALCLAVAGTGAGTALAQEGPAEATQKPRIAVKHRKLNVRAGRHARVVGRVAPALKGLAVSLQLKRDGRWKFLDVDRTAAGGRYRLRERVSRTGTTPLRVVIAAAPGVLPRARRVGRLNVFRAAYASWYGPGLYGNRLACGGVLSPGTLGVAHKTLPCGTKVTFKRGGREVRVPVVDRGPYVGGREYDLTAATAARLGFHGHGTILATR